MNITPRQIQILKAIIEEYMDTAEPVASEGLERKYNLGISPATIRNEMSDLCRKGFLKQPHTSAGRVPTSMALRFYVDNLMQEKKLPLTDEVRSKERVWDHRHHFDRLMRQSALALAERTGNLGVVATDQGDVYYAGISNLLGIPEFFDIDVTRTLLGLLEQQQNLRQLFFDRSYGQQPVHVIFGADLNWAYFEPIAMAFSYFNGPSGRRGSVAVIGPTRLNFPYVFPTLRYMSNLLSNLNEGW